MSLALRTVGVVLMSRVLILPTTWPSRYLRLFITIAYAIAYDDGA